MSNYNTIRILIEDIENDLKRLAQEVVSAYSELELLRETNCLLQKEIVELKSNIRDLRSLGNEDRPNDAKKNKQLIKG